MYVLYHIASRLYILVSALVAPVVCLGVWLLIAQTARKRLHSYTRWLRPAAVGSTLTGTGILLLTFVILVDHRNYGLAAIGYSVSTIGLVFGSVSFWRLWGVVKTLPPNPGTQAAEVGQQEGVWPPPPTRQP